jgi:hypothetical protein
MNIIDLQASLDTAEMEVMFNPTQFKRKVSAAYAKKRVLGGSHTPHEYLLTENAELSFELFYLVESPDDLTRSDDAMKFLESLLYAPAAGPKSIATFAPPRVHFFWPNTLAMTCRVMSIDWDHRRFNMDGYTVQWTARLKVEEARVQRLTKEQVREHGAIRTPQSTAVINDDTVFSDTLLDTSGDSIDLEGDIDLVYVGGNGEISF